MSREDDIIDIIVDGLDNLFDIDEASRETITAIVDQTEKELEDCEDIAAFIEQTNITIQNEIIPSVDERIVEIKRLFCAVDAMEKRVLPSLHSDLEIIESLVDNLERKVSKSKISSKISSIKSFVLDKVGIQSNKSSSQDISSPMSNDLRIPSDFPIHQQSLILEEVICAIPKK